MCEKESCGCGHSHGVILPAWNHTLKLFIYIFLFSACLNLVLEVAGIGKVESLFWSGSMFQPILTALIGFVPNCAASVLLTELYIKGVISFAAAVAGLCTSAGVGLVVLWRVNRNRKENIKMMGVLYGVAVVAGIILYWV
ncbi:MAG: putative manganese transporter [Faecalimonas sp.]